MISLKILCKTWNKICLSTLQAVDMVKVFRSDIILILYNINIIIFVEGRSFCDVLFFAQHHYGGPKNSKFLGTPTLIFWCWI